MVDQDNLYTYLDNNQNIAIHAFQGKEFVKELLSTHSVANESQTLCKELILSLQALIVFLKDNESMGIYLNCEEPKLNFKLETSAKGKSRILILPENFTTTKKILTGQCQITKFSPPDNTPYTSHIDFKDKTSNEILNIILMQSYQMDSYFLFKNEFEFLLLHKLPGAEENLNLREYSLEKNFELDNADEFQFLSSKSIRFECNCNKDRFVSRIRNLSNKDELINDCPLNIKCDYCKKDYVLELTDLT